MFPSREDLADMNASGMAPAPRPTRSPQRHTQHITLLGGCKGLVVWWDASPEAELHVDPIFATHIHEGTLADAKQKALRILPGYIAELNVVTG